MAALKIEWIDMRRRTIIIGTIAGPLLLIAATGAVWWNSVDLGAEPTVDAAIAPERLDIMRNAVDEKRGRILAVVTSTAKAPNADFNAGYELTELSRAYYVFKANGYEVDIASPKGGRPPVNIDEELFEADHAFLNDARAQEQVADTLRLSEVDPADYAAVYFVGGKGAMFDFPDNPHIQRIVGEIYDAGGVVGAVCHGPAALIGARSASGDTVLAGKRVTGFTDEEELFIIPDARTVFPFLLEERLRSVAGEYSEGPKYLDHTVVDGRLVTGQNPWSTWSVAENIVRALGHTPVARQPTREEQAIGVLETYRAEGMAAARLAVRDAPDFDKRTVLLHAIIELMEGNIAEAFRIQKLLH